jgi:hypothetical protein
MQHMQWAEHVYQQRNELILLCLANPVTVTQEKKKKQKQVLPKEWRKAVYVCIQSTRTRQNCQRADRQVEVWWAMLQMVKAKQSLLNT